MTRKSKAPMPIWAFGPLDGEGNKPVMSFGELIELMGAEAVHRLIEKPLGRQEDDRFDYLAERLSETNPNGAGEANDIVCFDAVIRREAVRIAVRLGYALARTDHGLGTYEDWLQQALGAAGLAGYQSCIEWSAPNTGRAARS
ncbi:MAG: hypothetical protein EPO21_18020 [Chloroflexota bacterium]|nr:MAG: hypothetical protein EPO21_18020 [Chloroflexota bacterium]